MTWWSGSWTISSNVSERFFEFFSGSFFFFFRFSVPLLLSIRGFLFHIFLPQTPPHFIMTTLFVSILLLFPLLSLSINPVPALFDTDFDDMAGKRDGGDMRQEWVVYNVFLAGRGYILLLSVLLTP